MAEALMRPAALLLLLAPALAVHAPRDKDADNQKPQALKALAGEWRLASTSDENREHPGNRLLVMMITEGGRVRFLLDGSETNSGIFTPARAAGKPKGIDLKLSR